MGELDGKTAIVTGATSGMGKGIGERFAAEGARIMIGGRNERRGEEVVRGIRSAGGEAEFLPGDVSKAATNRNLVEKTVASFGGVDILVASAGELGIGAITELSEDLWQTTIATNLSAVFYLMKYGIPEMRKRGAGSVVVIGSIAAFKVFPNHPAYCASKGALVQLVRQAALDYGPEIRVNMICPGQVDTPLLWNSAQAFPNPEEVVQQTAERLPLKRLGLPADIAEAALYLAGERASWITGSSFLVDGGSLCMP